MRIEDCDQSSFYENMFKQSLLKGIRRLMGSIDLGIMGRRKKVLPYGNIYRTSAQSQFSLCGRSPLSCLINVGLGPVTCVDHLNLNRSDSLSIYSIGYNQHKILLLFCSSVGRVCPSSYQFRNENIWSDLNLWGK